MVATKRIGAESSRAATVAMAMPLASAPTPLTATGNKRRRRVFEIVAGAVILILLLVVGGICAAADLQPTMSVDPTIAVPGDTVNVDASRLPADQAGQIQLHSNETYSFAFQAGGQGDFRQGIVIPFGVTTGMHVVSVCWGGSCPLAQTITLNRRSGYLPSPTPSTNPSPSASGTPRSTPSPRGSPRPGSTPSATPTAETPAPSRAPKPSPKLGALPTESLPGPDPSAVILHRQTYLAIGGRHSHDYRNSFHAQQVSHRYLLRGKHSDLYENDDSGLQR